MKDVLKLCVIGVIAAVFGFLGVNLGSYFGEKEIPMPEKLTGRGVTVYFFDMRDTGYVTVDDRSTSLKDFIISFDKADKMFIYDKETGNIEVYIPPVAKNATTETPLTGTEIPDMPPDAQNGTVDET